MLNYCTSGSLVRCVFSRTGVKRIPAGVITTCTMANDSSDTSSANHADTVEKVQAMRINYTVSKIDVENLPTKDPFKLFKLWFDEACEHPGIVEANAMSIATASKEGIPSCRVVLLKGFTENGFRFFTNYGSEKGRQLAENPHAALLFYWEPLQKQIRIAGPVIRLSDEESTKYFHSRPASSQLGALVSHQTTVIPNAQYLQERMKKLEEEYADKEIPKPDYWGGFIVKPLTFEFWCGGQNRLHSRVRFRKPNKSEQIDKEVTKLGENGWLYELLSP